MPDKEATARIRINKLLEVAGWRFFADGTAPANIRREPVRGLSMHDMPRRLQHTCSSDTLSYVLIP